MTLHDLCNIAKAVHNGYQIIYRPECIFDVVLLHSERLLIFGDAYKTFMEALTTP